MEQTGHALPKTTTFVGRSVTQSSLEQNCQHVRAVHKQQANVSTQAQTQQCCQKHN